MKKNLEMYLIAIDKRLHRNILFIKIAIDDNNVLKISD